MIKDALAIVDGSPRCHAGIDIAAELAQYHEAQLTLSVLFEQVPVITAVDPMSYGMALRATCDLQDGQLAEVRRELAKFEPKVALRSARMDTAAFPEAACQAGLTVDLALIGPDGTWCDARTRRHIVEELVVRGGTPTLLFPSRWKASRFSHAVLGWNGSPEASRAARALIALLEPGADIDVLVVDDGRHPEPPGGASADAIASHLARHGFALETHRRQTADRPAEQVLEDFTKSRGAQLLAIGGYSHSRLREGLLGGVTRALIDGARGPVLLAG
jgi:nucleotide-binding universal stress UspA family protein